MDNKNLEELIKNNANKIESNSERIHQNTGALEVLHTIKGYTNLFFIMWIITFMAFLCLLGYTIYITNDTTTITTTEEIAQENSDGDNNYIGRDGDISG